MKKIMLITILLMISLSLFAEFESIRQIFTIQTELSTFSQIKEVHNVPQFFEYLKNFVSWKHWRFWVGLLSAIVLWIVFIVVNGSFQELFNKDTQGDFVAKEGRYYLFWLGYSFIITIIFTFWYDYLIAFFSNINLLQIPYGQHWVIWTLWSGLVLLSLGAVWAILREIFVFKLVALYTIIYQILHGIIASILVFFVTLAITYFIIGVGIVLGVIIVAFVGISVLVSMLKGMNAPRTGSSYASDDDYDKALKKSNANEKRRRDDDRRWKEQQEKFNRDQMKKSRGW